MINVYSEFIHEHSSDSSDFFLEEPKDIAALFTVVGHEMGHRRALPHTTYIRNIMTRTVDRGPDWTDWPSSYDDTVRSNIRVKGEFNRPDIPN